VILSSGFAEAGGQGPALQAELARLCAGASFRLLGPNTAGFLNNDSSLVASFVVGAQLIPPGPVAVVAQSAGINLTVSFLLSRRGSGVSLAVGLGNAVDVDASDVLEFVAEQPSTKAIALHLEGITHGRRLYETLRRVTKKKPVVVLAVGKTDVREFALSHTGLLLGSQALRASAARQAGAVIVESTEELAAAAAVLALHRLPPNPRPGIGLMTAQAGAGIVMLDRLRARGVSVPTLADATVEEIQKRLPPLTYVKNPVDTGRPPPAFPEILEILASDPSVDAVISYALHERAALEPENVLPEVASRVRTPIVFGTIGPGEDAVATVAALRSRGIHVAESPEQLAEAACVLVEDAVRQARLGPEAKAAPSTGVAVPSQRDEHALKQMLAALAIPTPRGMACASHAEAKAAFSQLKKPVVAKILAPEIAHKTEAGGVQLALHDEAALERALAKLDAIPVTSPRRYLLEETAPSGLELMVGAVRDAAFGPTVTVGLGGVFAEALKDTSTRLAPLTADEAQQMLDELRAAPLLGGWRGGPPLDRAALASVLVRVGDFLCQHADVNELEINPLRVYPDGVTALDVLLR
jgi:acetyltransferase